MPMSHSWTPGGETPPPAWSPFKAARTWPAPSKPKLSMPRFRFFLKYALVLVLLASVYHLIYYTHWGYVAVEVDQTAAASASMVSDDWVWKDYPCHDGLVRGVNDLGTCSMSGPCDDRPRKMIEYEPPKSQPNDTPKIVRCKGPRGSLLGDNDEDAIWAYPGIATGAANPGMGSYEASGLDGNISFNRLGRFKAYGLEEFEHSSEHHWKMTESLAWDHVSWGSLQDDCTLLNQHRFALPTGSEHYLGSAPGTYHHTDSKGTNPQQVDQKVALGRTAILIRAWTEATWTADAIMNLRAMIAETSLASGGLYQVFILLHVRDDSIPLFTSDVQPQATIDKHIPPEFRSMTVVWNHAQIQSLYPNMREHAFVSRSPWMFVQHFARMYPDFEFFYHWEFDVRYTGHYLDFFEAVANFGRKQPRKGIWERAGRMYIPALHGAFDTDFRQLVHEEDPHHVWGPVPVESVISRGPTPPRREDNDDYKWGVGEDADWIGFLPSFNVTGTNWYFKDRVWGYPQKLSTPRRATLIVQGRVSRRLLGLMNHENSEHGHHMDGEMFPQTVCLHHGLKATSFPHPIYLDRFWPAESLEAVFNGGPFGQSGGFWNSTFSILNEHAWANTTWYYNSEQAKPLYQRFLGIATSHGGGVEWEDARGRALVRPMLLHPVKGAKALHWTPDGWK